LAFEVGDRLGAAEEVALAHDAADRRAADGAIGEADLGLGDLFGRRAEDRALVSLVAGADDFAHLVPWRVRPYPSPARTAGAGGLRERGLAETVARLEAVPERRLDLLPIEVAPAQPLLPELGVRDVFVAEAPLLVRTLWLI